jgi:hypothetical protein
MQGFCVIIIFLICMQGRVRSTTVINVGKITVRTSLLRTPFGLTNGVLNLEVS